MKINFLNLNLTGAWTRAAAVMLWSVVASAAAFGDDALIHDDVIHMDEKRSAFEALEVYIDRADFEQSGSAWMSRAEQGLAAVTAGWEDNALLIRKELEGYVNSRFETWLLDRFFRSKNRLELEKFYGAVGKANRNYLFDVDGEGKVRVDSAGDPLMKDGTGFSRDRASWKTLVAEKSQEVLKRWEDRVRAAQPELLAVLGNDHIGRNDRADAQFSASIAAYREGMRRQLNRLISAEESRFVAKRLRDQFSLRKKSDQKTASVMAEDLIEDVEESLEEGLATLRQGLVSDAVPGEPGSTGEQTAGPSSSENWQERFEKEVERGIEKWADAEKNLLARRAAWERELGTDFEEAERNWLKAYRRLEEARGSWEREFHSVLEEGRETWAEKEKAFAEALEEAQKELERSVEQRSGAVKERIRNLVEIYLEGKQTLRTAKTSGDHWIEKICEELGCSKPAFGTPASRKLLREGFLHHIGRVREEEHEQERERPEIIEYGADFAEYAARTWDGDWDKAPDESGWEALFADYRRSLRGLSRTEKARVRSTGRRMFLTVSGDLFGTEEPGEIYRYRELGYWLDLRDRYTGIVETAESELASTYGIVMTGSEGDELRDAAAAYTGVIENGGWKNVYLDDYQLELIKARASLDYWERQQEIAEAVAAYAEDTSSNRNTEAETQAVYESALRSYEKARKEYGHAVDRLKTAGEELADGRSRLQTIRTELDEIAAQLSEAQNRYTSAMDMYVTENNDYYQEKIRSFSDRLFDIYDTEEPEVRADYFEAAGRYWHGRTFETAADRLDALINGTEGVDGDGSGLSLKALKRRAESAAGWGFDTDQFQESLKTCFDIGPDHPLFGLLTAEFAAYTEAASAGDESSARYHKRRIGSITTELTLMYEQELQRRVESIAYVSSPDPQTWLESIGLSSAGLTEDTGTDLTELLRNRADAAALSYYRTRVQREKELLLAEPESQEQLSSRIAELEEIASFLNENGRIPESGEDGLNDYAELFFADQGMFFIDGVDLLAPKLTGETAKWRRARGRVSLVRTNRKYAPGETARITKKTIEEIAILAERYGLEENDLENRIAELSEDLPPYIAEEIERLLSFLSDSSDGETKDFRDYLTEEFLGSGHAVDEGEIESFDGPGKAVGALTDLEQYFGSLAADPDTVSAFYEGAGVILDGLPDFDFDVITAAAEELSGTCALPVSAETAYKKQYSTLRDVRTEADHLASEITRIGSSLESFMQDRDRMMEEVILPLEEELEALKEEYRSVQKRWNNAAKDFRTASQDYSTVQEQVRQKESKQAAAGFALEKAEAVLEYASSGYIDAAEAPAARLEETRSRREHAEMVFEVLRALHGEQQPEDFIHHKDNGTYREAFERYEDHYRRTVALKQLNGFLNEAVAKQEETVRRAKSQVDEDICEVFAGSVLNDKTELDGWFRSMHAELRCGGIEELKEWGLRYWHENESDKSDDIELAAGNTWSKDDDISSGCERAVQSAARRASGGDLYDFYISLYEKGLVHETGFLEDAAALTVQDHLYGEFRQRERTYEEEAESHWDTVDKLAEMVLIPGFGALFLPAIAVHTAEARAAEDEAEEWEEVRKEIGRLRKGSRRIVENSARDLKSKIKTYIDDKNYLLKQKALLASLKGENENPSAPLLSAEKLIGSIMKAGDILGEDVSVFLGLSGSGKSDTEEALRALLTDSGYTAELADADRTNSNNMLTSLTLIADREKDKAEEALKARTAELEAEQRKAVDAFRAALNTKKSPPALSALIRTAFGDAAFRESRHLARLYELERELGEKIDSVRFAFTAPLEKELVAARSRDLAAMEQGRSGMYLAANKALWRQKALELALRKARWEETMASIETRGTAEWRKSLVRLEAARKQWMDNYRSEYRKRSALWDRTYLAFKEKQNEWIQQAVEAHTRSVGKAVLENTLAENLPAHTERSIREISSVIVPSIETAVPDPKEVVARITGGTDFGRLLEAGRTVNRSITTLDPGVYAAAAGSQYGSPYGSPYISDSVLTTVSRFQNLQWGEIEKHVALVTADQARQAVEDAVTEVAETVDAANSSVDSGVAEELYRAGYHRSGSFFLRTVLVDDTLLEGKEHEEQEIREYKNYRMPDIVFGVDLSVNTLKTLSAEGVEAQIDNALEELGKFQEKIFGEQDSDDEGWFDEHVGDPAELAEDADIENTIEENLEEKGSGELGRIFTVFWENELASKKGWNEYYKPDYEKRLWDDDGSIIEAPTLRTVADLAIGTAAAVLLPGAGNLLAAAALNMADDLLFTAMDITEGGVSVEKGLTGLAGKALTSLAGSAVGNAYSAVGSTLGKAGLDGIGKTALKGLELFQTNLVRGAAGAVEWDDDLETLDFNSEKFTDSIIGESAIAGYIGGLTGTFLEGNLEGFSSLDSSELKQFTGFAGGALEAGAEYGLTGSTTLNIANIADVGGLFGMDSLPRSGLFEMDLSEDDGISFSFGSEGVDAGIGALAGAAEGFDVWTEQVRIGAYDTFGTAAGTVRYAEDYTGYRSTGTMMRSLYSFGDETGRRRYEDLLSGTSHLLIGAREDFRGKTVATEADKGPDLLTCLTTLGQADDQASRLRAGITLQHEAWRDGVESSADLQFTETVRAVLAHTEMALEIAGDYGSDVIAGDPALTSDVEAYLAGSTAFLDRVASGYDMRDDYWKLTVFDEHLLTYDGSRDLTVEYVRRGAGKNGDDVIFGTERFEDRTGSWAASLANTLGLDRARELLGGDLSRLSLYDDQTLQDVLGASRDTLRHDPGFSFADLTIGEKLRLAGEALLKSSGSLWDPDARSGSGAWTGLDGLKLTLTDNPLSGQLAVDQLPDGSFERFTVTADVIRNEESYGSFYTKSLPSAENNKGLDRAHFYKQDLSGSILAGHTVSDLQTVDVFDRVQEYFGDDDELLFQVDRNQPYDHPYFGTIQGNTIDSSSFGMRVEEDGNFVLHDASTISGDGVDWQGLNHDIGGGRWLWHSGTWQNSDGCFIPPQQEHNELLDVLENWGVPTGYDIETALRGTTDDYQSALDSWYGYW